MALFPVIIPLVAVLVPTRFLFSSRASQTRVWNLQHERKLRFAQVFSNLQQELSKANIIQITEVDESNKDPATSPATIHSPSASSQPLLTHSQQTMLRGLNDLPNVHKHHLWIAPARNTHAIVIWREPQFPGHARGEGVLRHWADHFIA